MKCVEWMRPEEAIETLKALQGAVEWDFPLDYAAAIDAAVEALGKQVPMEMMDKLDISGEPFRVCGRCGDYPAGGDYCRWCGQKIKRG